MRKHLSYILISILMLAGTTSCHEMPENENTLQGNFESLWRTFDERYCFFREKGVDWDAIGRKYKARVDTCRTVFSAFDTMAEMVGELKDGHVNIISTFSSSYYRKWWSEYPQDFDWRTVQQYYLDFDYYQTSGISYKMLDGNIGYMRYPSFSYAIGKGNLDYVLALLQNSRGIIIDIRDNGGGQLTNIDRLVSRFISRKISGGSIIHKTGPGHGDFSEPFEFFYEPSEKGRVTYFGRIVVLTNRSCFSAANNFTAVMKGLDGVRIVGARTGGGGGMPFSSELPNGWGIRFSACPILDREGNCVENGVDPDPGCEVHSPAEELAEGKDAILDFAISMLKGEHEELWTSD